MRHGNPVPQRRGGTDDGQRGTGLAPQARVAGTAGSLAAEAVVSKAKANEGVLPHAGRRREHRAKSGQTPAPKDDRFVSGQAHGETTALYERTAPVCMPY